MRLKLVVATMSLLGLVSSPAFANHHNRQNNTAPAAAVHHDYKDMAPACSVSQDVLTLVQANQNVGRALPNPCNAGWFERIRVSGGINVDAGKWGNQNANYMGENYQRFSLNDAYLNVAANVSDWTNVFVSLSFGTPTTMANPAIFNMMGAAEYSAAYANNIGGTGNNNFQVEQAFGTFANFNVTPIYLQAGKAFQDFSRYEIHPITRSLTQVMSETLAASVKLGFVANNFNGGVYVFNDPIRKLNSSSNPTNYGVSLGYDLINDQFGWDVGAGYMYNIIAANDIAYAVNNFTACATCAPGYNNRVGGVALYADVNYGPFMGALRYTQAVQRFNRFDLTKNGNADLAAGSLIGSNTPVVPLAGATGAKPWAAGAQVGYGFEVWNKSQNVYLGYQASREAAGLDLPKGRWLVGYGIDVVKDTSLGLEWDHDQAFSVGNGGTGNTTNLVSLRASAKFS